MCGINGAFTYKSDGKVVDADELVLVRDYMAHRGPDASGLWISSDNRVGLGHRRLSIIDLSPDGNQPMSYADDRFQITFNGEIYNYQELRANLTSRGFHFKTNSDTEVILALFADQGVEAMLKLRGMFAFAIWDEREREMILARDPMGIKPLYYAVSDGVVRFASEVKALIHGGSIDTSPSAAGHVGFLTWGHIPGPYTLYKGIQSLPPGSYLRVKDGELGAPKTYFSLKECFLTLAPEERQGSLESCLRDSVKHHFVSDVPVSLFLSAGRDSATLLGLASEVCADPVNTITLGFHEYANTHDDEIPLAREIADLYGAKHLASYVSGNEFREDINSLLAAMDQPSVDGANTYYVCKVSKGLGIKVALSGLGADEMFGGYPSFVQIPKITKLLGWTGRTSWMGRSSRRLLASIPTKRSPKIAGTFEYGGTIEGAYLLRRALHMPWEIPYILDRDLATEGIGQLDIMGSLRALTANLPTPHCKISMLELSCYMQDRLLRDSDWASMANSLELRVPFVDVSVMRQVGPWIASDWPPTKQDMASCPATPLPTAVLTRPKTGFNVPITDWALELDPTAPHEHSHRQWAKYLYRQHTGGHHLTLRV